MSTNEHFLYIPGRRADVSECIEVISSASRQHESVSMGLDFNQAHKIKKLLDIEWENARFSTLSFVGPYVPSEELTSSFQLNKEALLGSLANKDFEEILVSSYSENIEQNSHVFETLIAPIIASLPSKTQRIFIYDVSPDVVLDRLFCDSFFALSCTKILVELSQSRALDLKKPIMPTSIKLALEEIAIEKCLGVFDCAYSHICRSPQLRSLKLINCGLSSSNIEQLCSLPNAHLNKLSLINNEIGDDGVEILLSSKLINQLENLDLDGCSITDQGARLIARSKAAAVIPTLSLTRNDFGLDAYLHLANSPYFDADRRAQWLKFASMFRGYSGPLADNAE